MTHRFAIPFAALAAMSAPASAEAFIPRLKEIGISAGRTVRLNLRNTF